MLGQLRAGDVLVIWKLARMGRSHKHLVELVGSLMERKFWLLSLNDPIDTTSAQGRLVLNLFASLAEFEHELIRGRTQAGLSAARARGRVGGRPKGLTPQAEATALAADTLYRERKLSVAAIAQKLHVSESTLYSYLRHRGVEIGSFKKPAQAQPSPSTSAGEVNPPKVATIRLMPRIENNSNFVRGKKRAREDIERYCSSEYDGQRLPAASTSRRGPTAVMPASTNACTSCWATPPARRTISTASRRAMPAWKAPTATGDAGRSSRLAVPLLAGPQRRACRRVRSCGHRGCGRCDESSG